MGGDDDDWICKSARRFSRCLCLTLYIKTVYDAFFPWLMGMEQEATIASDWVFVETNVIDEILNGMWRGI